MNKKIKHICFDLDGTLVDSAKTIYDATIKTFQDLHIKFTLDENQFNKMIGMHFADIFTHFQINVPDFEKFILHYKQVYFDFIDTTKLYPGVEDTLIFLKNNSFKISILTTKAQDQTERILRHFNITNNFDLIMGRRNGIPHKPSPIPFQIICDNLNIPAENSMIVGDTELDILCGKNANTITVAVTYGYRPINKLKEFSPNYLIDNLKELKSILNL